MRCTSATGRGELLAAMALATASACRVAYLQALIAPPDPAREVITPLASPAGLQPPLLVLADLPPQAEVDRALSTYESYVWIPDRGGPGRRPWRRWARCGHDRRPPGQRIARCGGSAARAPGAPPGGGHLAELARSRRGSGAELQRLPARPARRGGRRHASAATRRRLRGADFPTRPRSSSSTSASRPSSSGNWCCATWTQPSSSRRDRWR